MESKINILKVRFDSHNPKRLSDLHPKILKAPAGSPSLSTSAASGRRVACRSRH